ncbi:hypothetical protein [Mycobacterium sp. 1274761.0]|uniref:hypothetical protein n=1 Tax=Mycobacterium sp. 1274761.0 TaxID=1834077 RepID=UPI0007FBF49F|nr:hypothetical protein [Mycobacterium sp. 1274761.0]OBK75262.1 hypothetical protein A5651_07645 [Mycobacterium sp. 1274761.0]
MKNSTTALIGGAAVIAAAAGLTTGDVCASAAPQNSPGVVLSVTDDPANPANYLLRVEGKLPMSEGDAYDRLAHLAPGGGMDYIVYADDPGDNDNPIGLPHGYIGAPGPAGGLLIATPYGLSFTREISVPRGDLNEDFCFSFGCGDDTDEVYVKVRFVQGNGVPELRAYTNAVSGTF